MVAEFADKLAHNLGLVSMLRAYVLVESLFEKYWISCQALGTLSLSDRVLPDLKPDIYMAR